MDFTVGTKSAHTGLTNRAAFAAAHPRNNSYALNYIYDNFEWPHCDGEGYDFSALIEELYESAATSATATATATAGQPKAGFTSA